jgi:hypothetical protein
VTGAGGRRYGCLPGPVGSGKVVVLPTLLGDIVGGTPTILAASEIGNVIARPTSAGDTPGGTPMAFTASARGMVDGARGNSGVASPAAAFGWLVVPACAWTGGGGETCAKELSGTGEAVSCVTLVSSGAEGITNTFTMRDPCTPPRNA